MHETLYKIKEDTEVSWHSELDCQITLISQGLLKKHRQSGKETDNVERHLSKTSCMTP